MKAYSVETMETSMIVSSIENLWAVAVDSMASKIYFSSNNGKIYRANMDGSDQETVLNTDQCKFIGHQANSCISNHAGNLMTSFYLILFQTQVFSV